MQVNDAEIVAALQQSDERVFEQLFRFYYQRLCSYATGLLNDKDEAEETVQQVFVNVWEKRFSMEINVSLKSYLYRAVHNASINAISRQNVRTMYAGEQLHHAEQVYEHTSQSVIKNELEKNIHKAINTLPEQCRMVFKLSRFEEMKYAEIAEHLGISIKTVENHMGKALKLLREQLKDYLAAIVILFPWLLNNF